MRDIAERRFMVTFLNYHFYFYALNLNNVLCDLLWDDKLFFGEFFNVYYLIHLFPHCNNMWLNFIVTLNRRRHPTLLIAETVFNNLVKLNRH